MIAVSAFAVGFETISPMVDENYSGGVGKTFGGGYRAFEEKFRIDGQIELGRRCLFAGKSPFQRIDVDGRDVISGV
ncbi:MAG: hypothetical protein ACP5G4_08000 [bacterium]